MFKNLASIDVKGKVCKKVMKMIKTEDKKPADRQTVIELTKKKKKEKRLCS